MKYLVCEKPGKFVLREKSRPQRSAGQSLVKIEAVGLCGTDLHAYKGQQAFFSYPRVLGHELSARILESDLDNFEEGDRVIIMPYINCDRCYACRIGKSNCCTNMKVMGVHIDGGMQEEILVSDRLLLKAENLKPEEVAIIEPLAIGAHALRRASVGPNSTVLVAGCGPIGIGIIKLAQIAGAKVIALDTNEYRLEFVRRVIGNHHIVKAGENALKEIAQITNNDLANVVFDASGNKAALEKGIEYMSHGGTYVLVGLSKGHLEFHHPSIHAKESSILCSRNATREDFLYVKGILSKKLFPTDSYITHQSKIVDLAENISTYLDPSQQLMKALLHF